MEIHGIDIREFYPCAMLSETVPGRRHGRKVSVRTVERWRCNGLQRGDKRIKLRVIRLGNDLHTCDKWLEEFFQAGNLESDFDASQTASPRTPSQRENESAAARKKLDAIWKPKSSGQP